MLLVLTLMHFSHVACFSFQSDRSSNIEAPNPSKGRTQREMVPDCKRAQFILLTFLTELALKVGYIASKKQGQNHH